MSDFIDPKKEIPELMKIVEIRGSNCTGQWTALAHAENVGKGAMNAFKKANGEKWKFILSNGWIPVKARDVEGWRYL